jgi:hypothetical protein
MATIPNMSMENTQLLDRDRVRENVIENSEPTRTREHEREFARGD